MKSHERHAFVLQYAFREPQRTIALSLGRSDRSVRTWLRQAERGLRALSPTALAPGTVAGLSLPKYPYLNWLASDVVSNPAIPYEAILAAHVHELGNSLAAISGRSSPAQDPRMFRYDRDSGNGLTECVYGGFVLPGGTITTNPGGY